MAYRIALLDLPPPQERYVIYGRHPTSEKVCPKIKSLETKVAKATVKCGQTLAFFAVGRAISLSIVVLWLSILEHFYFWTHRSIIKITTFTTIILYPSVATIKPTPKKKNKKGGENSKLHSHSENTAKGVKLWEKVDHYKLSTQDISGGF